MNIQNEEIFKNKFELKNNNTSYDFFLEKTNDYIIIKCLNYQAKFNKGNISELFCVNFNSINDEYNYILNLFINNKVSIYEVIENNNIILSINFNSNIKYIYLVHSSQNQNFIINKYYNKIKALESNSNKYKIKNDELNINKIQLKNIKNIEAYCINSFCNSFIIFNSPFSYIYYLIYITKENKLISYDLNSEQIIAEINEPQGKDIRDLEYCLDTKNKRDLLMLYNYIYNSIKIYNVKNWEIILNLEKINNLDCLLYACFFNDIRENEYYIITNSINYSGKSDDINIFDLNGKFHKKIKNSNEKAMKTKTFYDDKLDKNFIITLNEKFLKSYDYEQNNFYKKYSSRESSGYHNLDIIKTKYGVTQLISFSAGYGIIYIWNFHTGILLNQINIGEKFFVIHLYNERNIFIGTIQGNVILMDLLSQENKKFEKMQGNYISCIKSFFHKKEEKCLITHGNDNKIKIFKILE